MSRAPAEPGSFEVVVLRGRGRAWAARARVAGEGGRARLLRVRRWLSSPRGRRVSLRVGQGMAAGVLALTAVVTLRQLLSSARRTAEGLVAAVRQVVSAAGAVGSAVRRVLSLRWLSHVLGILAVPRHGAGHTHCGDCHARIRQDARVCFRCRAAQASRVDEAGGRLRTGARAGRLTWRILTLTLYRRCPDCRRRVHVDAKRCFRCGAELRRRD